MGGLVEQLGAHQEDQLQASVGREERVREAEEKAEQWRWRAREEERERGEREKELEASRVMERSLRYCAMHQDVIYTTPYSRKLPREKTFVAKRNEIDLLDDLLLFACNMFHRPSLHNTSLTTTVYALSVFRNLSSPPPTFNLEQIRAILLWNDTFFPLPPSLSYIIM